MVLLLHYLKYVPWLNAMPDVLQQPITSQGIGGGGVLGASLLRSDPIVPATMASCMFVNNTWSCGRRQNVFCSVRMCNSFLVALGDGR